MSHGVRSCASCEEIGCAMQKLHGVPDLPAERTAWVLDDVWPETASVIAAQFGPGDQLIAPGMLGPRPARYAWPVPGDHPATFATLRRHGAMRWVARGSGGVRQRTYLHHDRALAHRLARAIDYRARHLVVAQAWLPWLDEVGALGGRSFDVVMSRYPFGEIHRMLDTAANSIGGSSTIADFRADAPLVEREAALLARARRIMTPHHGIAALFPDRGMRLAWHRPAPPARVAGTRVAFLGPTIARERPDIVRAQIAAIDLPLIVFGRIVESSFWEGVAIERRQFGAHWLDDIGSILHPATFTAQPRKLLEALAAGVTVHATPGSGLDPADYRVLDTGNARNPLGRPA